MAKPSASSRPSPTLTRVVASPCAPPAADTVDGPRHLEVAPHRLGGHLVGVGLGRAGPAVGKAIGLEPRRRGTPPPPMPALGGAPQRRLGSGPLAGRVSAKDAAAARPEAARASNHAA